MCLRLSARRIMEAGEARNLFACEVTRSIDRAPKPAIRSSNGGGGDRNDGFAYMRGQNVDHTEGSSFLCVMTPSGRT